VAAQEERSFQRNVVQRAKKRSQRSLDMSRLIKAVAGVSLLMFTTSAVMAQTTPNTSSGWNQPGQNSTQDPDKNAVQNERPTDPNLPRTQPEINKLQKDERTGKSTGN
jgi:hypothetical protein